MYIVYVYVRYEFYKILGGIEYAEREIFLVRTGQERAST